MEKKIIYGNFSKYYYKNENFYYNHIVEFYEIERKETTKEKELRLLREKAEQRETKIKLILK
jgi:hypothetical protein